MQWMVTENQLGQEQTLILDQCLRSNVRCKWIKGFAGSGKTVLLVHLMETLRATQPGKTLCFVTFTHALKDLVSTGLSDRTRDLPVITVDRFIKERKRYHIVLADEIQDLEIEKLTKLKAMCDHLIVAGDLDQSIYPSGVGPNEIDSLLTPETYSLTVLYRLTQSLQFLARALLPGTSIAGAKISRQQDTDIVLAQAKSSDEEIKWVIDKAITVARPGKPAVIILPTQEDIFKFMVAVATIKGVDAPRRSYKTTHFGSRGPRQKDKLDWDAINHDMNNSKLPFHYLGSSFGDLLESDRRPLIYIMTYHSAKGLDFPHVFLPMMNSDVKLWRNDDKLERRLFFVGVTRSRENLFISYSSKQAHPFVEELPKKYLSCTLCAQTDAKNNDPDSDYLF